MQRPPLFAVRVFGFPKIAALAALASVGPARVCSAVSITVSFAGYVFSDTPGDPYPAATPFEGAVTYDSGVSPDFVDDSTRAGYFFPGGLGAASFSIGATTFESVTSDDPDFAMLQLVVENDYAAPALPNSPPSRPRDRYFFLYTEDQESVLEVEFRALTSPSLPPDLEPIQSLEIPTLASQFEPLTTVTVRYQDPIGDWIVHGAVTSITVVPEPSTIQLFALGVVALSISRRCTRPPSRLRRRIPEPAAGEGMGRPRRPPHP